MAKPSTRRQSCSGSAIPADRRWRRWQNRGNPRRFALPRPLIDRPGADFSFSGLKTALRLAAEAAAPLSDTDVADLCASFQAAVTDIVANRADHAMRAFADDHDGPHVLVVAGGVAANQALRAALRETADAVTASALSPRRRACVPTMP